MQALLIAVFCALLPALSAGEPAIGSTRADVLTALGEPRGEAQMGQRTILFYKRGSLELTGGLVSKLSLVPAEEYAKRAARLAAEAEQERAEAEVRRAKLVAAGEAIKAGKLTDESFRATPLAYQVAFWQDFALKYPGVPCAEELTIARLRLAEKAEAKRADAERERRLAEMEARTTAAEARTPEAEAEIPMGLDYAYGYGYPIGRYGIPFTLWPIRYHFGDAFTAVSPVRSPGLIPDTPVIGRRPVNVFSPLHCPDRVNFHFCPVSRRGRLLHRPRI